MTAIRLRLRINILSFGSATMRKRAQRKGNEPDACFYVQSAHCIGNRLQLDFATDPPPDIAVEVDVHHDSRNKLSIYAVLAVPEVWRFDGEVLTIHLLEQGSYRESATSLALPMLTSRLLTDALTRVRTEGELAALMASMNGCKGSRFSKVPTKGFQPGYPALCCRLLAMSPPLDI